MSSGASVQESKDLETKGGGVQRAERDRPEALTCRRRSGSRHKRWAVKVGKEGGGPVLDPLGTT